MELKDYIANAVVDLLEAINQVKPKYLKDYVESINILLSYIAEEEVILALKNPGPEEDFWQKVHENKVMELVNS